MRNPAVPLALLAPLMLVSTASRLSAGGETRPPQEKKKVVIASPDKKIVVDGDDVVVWGNDDFPGPEVFADLPDFDDHDFPRVVRFHGHPGGGYLGVRSIAMTPELRQHFGAPTDAGVLVGTVEPESPAAKAGIQVGDILTAVDGEPVGSTHALSRSVRRHKDGETVKIDLLRDRARKTLAVTLVKLERKANDGEVRIGEFGPGMRDFALRDWNFDVPAIAPVPPRPPDAPRWNGLKDRVDSLEQRLKDIESRLPPR